ncbi:MAG: hypothetical protein GXO26_08765, partial [Crenarchaeota archaeon]|nr:hypothetical protein [Thermoproteota archaeon]
MYKDVLSPKEYQLLRETIPEVLEIKALNRVEELKDAIRSVIGLITLAGYRKNIPGLLMLDNILLLKDKNDAVALFNPYMSTTVRRILSSFHGCTVKLGVRWSIIESIIKKESIVVAFRKLHYLLRRGCQDVDYTVTLLDKSISYTIYAGKNFIRIQ